MVSAGRVLIMPRGAYDASETYSMLDLVSYNGSSYIAKKSTTGNLPTNTTYWQLSAYGGSASNIAGNFATLETTDYASQNYAVGDYLVTKDSQLCEVIATITTGDELVLDTNIEVTSVEAMIEGVKDYVDDLDEENVKLKGMTAISVQTDLDTMTTLGNYYKASGSFYVTNAPTGIDSEITALFRLTVENGSDSTDKYLQTLITNDGKTYKRGYDGSDWSDWIEFSTADVVATKQPKTLDTAITIDGTSKTTVEGALDGLNTYIDSVNTTSTNNDDAMLNMLGSKNLLPNDATTQTIYGVTLTVNSDGSVIANGTATNHATLVLTSTLALNGDYILSGCPSGGGSDKYEIQVLSSASVAIADDYGESVNFNTNDTVTVRLVICQGTTVSNLIFKPMIRPAGVQDSTYVPYAMTNRQLSNAFEVNTGVSGLHAYKVGRVVMLSSTLPAFSGESAGWKVITTLPRELTPLGGSLYFNFFDNSANTQASSTVVETSINSSNVLSIYLYSDKLTVTPWGVVTYISKY